MANGEPRLGRPPVSPGEDSLALNVTFGISTVRLLQRLGSNEDGGIQEVIRQAVDEYLDKRNFNKK